MLYANVLPDDEQRRNAVLQQAQKPLVIRSKQPRTLTERELEILRLIAYSNAEIAKALVPPVAEGTVRNAVTDIMIALRVRTRTAAAIAAVKRGIVDIELIEVEER